MSTDSPTTAFRTTSEDLGFDPDALREKYRIERERRLRPEGNKQYVYPDDVSLAAQYVSDPWSDPIERDPITEAVEVCVIGAGLGGIQAAVLLRDAGVDSMRIIDKAGGFGGVWYWNRYPGAQCDVDAYIYLPFLERMNYTPSEKYSSAKEIREHCEAVAHKFDLYRAALFQTVITEVRWDEANQTWLVGTDRGDRISARYVVVCPGGLQQPKLPGVPGIERFKGSAFHASRWNREFTGGDQDTPMDRLGDKKVAVIGTGATALQCIPHLAEAAAHLYVFQRTPNLVSARDQKKTDPDWFASLPPGWQLERQRNFLAATSGLRPEIDLIDDGWTHQTRFLTFTGESNAGEGASTTYEDAELEDFKVTERIRRRIETSVHDPVVADALKPYFRFFCKRPGFSDNYLASFNRPNVTLVDTDGAGPDEVTETGVVFAGQTYEVDGIVFCTGFDTGNGYLHGKGFDVVGRGGLKLSDYWANGMRTFQGIHSRNFPNCFFMGSTQTSITLNYSHCLLEQAEHIVYTLSECKARGRKTIETSQSAEDDWVAAIHAGWTPSRKRFAIECTPSFFNNEGKPFDPNGHIYNYVAADPLSFFDSLAAWREEGQLRGLELS